MKQIILTSGHLVQVSDRWYDYLNQFDWRLGGWSYAQRSEYGTGTILLHHEVISLCGLLLPEKYEVDHKDRNTMNCQDENLRVVTVSGNRHNRPVQSNNAASEHRGIYYLTKIQKWEVHLSKDNVCIIRKQFVTEDEAIKARIKAEKEYLNRPTKIWVLEMVIGFKSP
jgi:hypothetical protein